MSMTGYKMRFPIIKIRDKHSGSVHIVGTNSHDELYVGKDGQLHYGNMQCCDGSGADEDYGYIFDGVDNGYDVEPVVEFVTFDGLIEIMKEQANLSAERERKFREMAEDMWRKHDEECEKSVNDGFLHS